MKILVQILTYWFWISGWCDYYMQTDTVYRQELTFTIHYISCICDTDTIYKQVIDIYMHACRLTRQLQAWELTIIVSQATPSLRRVWLARVHVLALYVFTIYISMYNSKSLLYRETCFKLATCADFSISDFGDKTNFQISNLLLSFLPPPRESLS